MHKDYRNQINKSFTKEKYKQLHEEIVKLCGVAPAFRVAESPVFVPDQLWQQVINASRQLVDFIVQPNFKELSEGAFPMDSDSRVPNETPHPQILSFDFGICEDENGNLSPKLIEFQGFPTLCTYQLQLYKAYQAVYPEIAHLSPFIDIDETEYLKMLHTMLGKKNTVLMDIEPTKQNTYVDFKATEKYFGMPYLCMSDIIKEDRKLYYIDKNGEKKHIEYIYNRVIFDELLQRSDLKRNFSFLEDLDIKWISHPNWYFRMSKYILPFMDMDFVPKSYFLSDVKEYPSDLKNYILKPLYSFSGQGVQMDITAEDLDNIKNRQNYLLQEKVKYAPVIEAPDGQVKFEFRVIALWPLDRERPVLTFNLVRMSKGAMVGVKYNKDKEWVGSSIALRVP